MTRLRPLHHHSRAIGETAETKALEIKLQIAVPPHPKPPANRRAVVARYLVRMDAAADCVGSLSGMDACE